MKNHFLSILFGNGKATHQDLYQYSAFISYKHNSRTSLVTSLVSALKNYAKPTFARPIKIFRDENHLTPGLNLPHLIQQKLIRSEFLILLASPGASASTWINDELRIWCSDLNRTENLIIVLLEGTINIIPDTKDVDWENTDCLPLALREYITSVPYYLDLRSVSDDQATLSNPTYKHAVNAIVSRFRNLDPNEMLGEEIAQYRRGRRIRNFAASIIALFAIGFSIATFYAEGQRRKAFHELLEAAGRETVLASRENRPSAGLSTLRAAIKSSSSRLPILQIPLPHSAIDAGFLALLEDRSGPKLSFELGKKTSERLSDENQIAPTTASAFNLTGTMVASGSAFDAAIWRVSDGKLIRRIQTNYEIEKILFSENSSVLLLVTFDTSGRRSVAAVDINTGKSTARFISKCGNIPCLAGGSSRGPLRYLSKITDLKNIKDLGSSSAYQYIVPTANYRGAAAGRYHIFLEDTDHYSNTIYMIDEVTQLAATTDVGDEEMTISQGQPVFAVGGVNVDEGGSFLRVYDLVAASGELKANEVKKYYLPNVKRTASLSLDYNGDTLYFNTHKIGTGGGQGIRMSGAIDIKNGRLLWGKPFEGSTIYSDKNKVLAQVGYTGSVLNARDGERIFDFDGHPLLFSEDGSMLLSGLQSKKISAQKIIANLQLTEVLKTKQFTSYDLAPRSVRGECDFSEFPFRRIESAIGRRWNSYDWEKRSMLPEDKHANALPSLGTRATIYRLDFEKNRIKVSEESNEEYLSEERQLAIAKRYIAVLGSKPKSGSHYFSISTSSNNRWTGEMSLFQPDNQDDSITGNWRIFDNTRNKKLIADGTVQWEASVNAGNNSWMSSLIHFLPDLDLAFVQHSECRLNPVSLTSGKSLSQISLAYTNLFLVERVSADVILIGTSDWYGATTAMQLASIPDFRPGPTLVFAEELENDNALGDITVLGSEEVEPLLAVQEIGEEPMDDLGYCPETISVLHGRFIALSPEKSNDCKISPKGSYKFKLPPWGKRLEAILRSP